MDHRFVWYDLLTTDLDAALAFYGDVASLGHADSGMPNMRYDTLSAGGTPIGGAMQLTEEMRQGGARPCWLGYVEVDDTDATLEKLTALGGSIQMGKTAIPNVGWFAMVSDPQGATFQLFQRAPDYAEHPPIPAGTPGKIGWRELLAADWKKAWDFYEALFGWKKNDAIDMGPLGTYQLWRAYGNDPDGGMFTKAPHVPHPLWMFYLVVHGAAAAAERVKAGGGEVLNGPMEVPGGGWVLQGRDPQGAMFALLSDTP